MQNKKKRFSWWIIPLAAVAAMVGTLFWFRAHPVMVQAQAPAVDLSTLTTAPVQLGSISSAVNATGTVESNRSTTLSWQLGGQVAKVLVKQGDQVQANQILAQIDPSSSTNLVTAQADLLTAQQNLANIQDVAVAQAQAQVNVIKAEITVMTDQNNLNALYTPPSQAAISETQYAILNDQQKVSKDQDNYDYWLAYIDVPHCTAPTTGGSGGHGGFGGFGGRGGGGGGGGGSNLSDNIVGGRALPKCITMTDTQIQMQQANALRTLDAQTQKLNQDEATLNHLQNFKPYASLVSSAQNALAIAKANLASAQASWDAIKNGPNPSQVAAAQSQIDSIKASIDQQYIRAPFAGTVTDVAVKPGDLVSPGTYAFEIDNLSPLLVTLQVSEIDINNVSVGQTAALTFDAAPGKKYSGQITQIDPNGTVTNGVSNFGVTLQMSSSDSLIRPGMTTAATITVNSANNVMIVPIQAVVSQGNKLLVYVLNGGSITPVTVTLGLANNTQVAINSNSIKAGDMVVTNPSDIPATQATPQATGGSTLNNIFNKLGVTRLSTSQNAGGPAASQAEPTLPAAASEGSTN